MIEALWSVEFKTDKNYGGSGIAVFENGRVLGGDATYYYVGSYQIKDGVASASLEVIHYAGPLNNVFGAFKKVSLTLSGEIGHDSFVVSGTAKEAPGQISIRLTRRAELP